MQRSFKMAKRYISKKDLARVKELDLLTYLKNYEPQELVKNGRNDYVTQTHGSLHISNGLWCWWAQNIGGRTALKYLIEVEGMEFLDAALYLKGLIDKQPPVKVMQRSKSSYCFRLPYRYENDDRIINYLVNERKINKDIVNYCIKSKLIYESANDHAVVFVGYDESHLPKFACKRATDSALKKDIPGSDKAYSFSVKNSKSKSVHVFESAIDLMSYMTILKRNGKDYLADNYLSIDGASLIGKSIHNTEIPVALNHFLENNEINSIHLHLDNDKAGKDTVLKIQYHLENQYEIKDSSPKNYKDINEELIAINHISSAHER